MSPSSVRFSSWSSLSKFGFIFEGSIISSLLWRKPTFECQTILFFHSFMFLQVRFLFYCFASHSLNFFSKHFTRWRFFCCNWSRFRSKNWVSNLEVFRVFRSYRSDAIQCPIHFCAWAQTLSRCRHSWCRDLASAWQGPEKPWLLKGSIWRDFDTQIRIETKVVAVFLITTFSSQLM